MYDDRTPFTHHLTNGIITDWQKMRRGKIDKERLEEHCERKEVICVKRRLCENYGRKGDEKEGDYGMWR